MFNNIHIKAVDAQMPNFSFFPEPGQGVEQIVSYVGNFRSMKVQQRYSIQSKPDEARLDGPSHPIGRKVLAPSTAFIRA